MLFRQSVKAARLLQLSSWLQLRPRPLNSSASSVKSDVMSRTRVITDEHECSEIVTHLLRKEEPIAVDMEGVTLPAIALIQVKSMDGNIYLFRTGYNHSLITKGRLADLFESSSLTKIMHAASVDMQALFRENIHFWGLYDTALAHKVITYQSVGRSLSQDLTSFNNVCEHYGLPSNPMKVEISVNLWKRLPELIKCKTLPEDLAYYSAWDVEPLFDLYDITRSLIDNDFKPVLSDLCDCEILRSIDPKLVSAKQLLRSKTLYNDVFIHDLSDRVNKNHLYKLVSRYSGFKKVLYSNSCRTAHLIFDNRETAIDVLKHLEKGGFPVEFGSKAQAKLVSPLTHREIFDRNELHERNKMKLLEKNFIVDPQVSRTLVDKLLQVQCPVVIEVHASDPNSHLSVFILKTPLLKFVLDQDMLVNGGLGELLASPNVTKIVARIDTDSFQSLLKLCSLSGFRPNNFFDISAAFKTYSYWREGRSIYMSSSSSVRDIMDKFGLSSLSISPKQSNYLYFYMHIKDIFPPRVMEILDQLSQIEIDVGAQIDLSESKARRKKFRSILEHLSIHVIVDKKKNRNAEYLHGAIADTLTANGLDFTRIDLLDANHAVVELEEVSQKVPALECLHDQTVKGLTLKASNIDCDINVNEERVLRGNKQEIQQKLQHWNRQLDDQEFFSDLMP